MPALQVARTSILVCNQPSNNFYRKSFYRKSRGDQTKLQQATTRETNELREEQDPTLTTKQAQQANEAAELAKPAKLAEAAETKRRKQHKARFPGCLSSCEYKLAWCVVSASGMWAHTCVATKQRVDA